MNIKGFEQKWRNPEDIKKLETATINNILQAIAEFEKDVKKELKDFENYNNTLRKEAQSMMGKIILDPQNSKGALNLKTWKKEHIELRDIQNQYLPDIFPLIEKIKKIEADQQNISKYIPQVFHLKTWEDVFLGFILKDVNFPMSELTYICDDLRELIDTINNK